MTPLLAATLCLLCPQDPAAPDATDKQLDRTGIAWTLPFDRALERARTEQRLLLIKPIAFGTSADGGW